MPSTLEKLNQCSSSYLRLYSLRFQLIPSDLPKSSHNLRSEGILCISLEMPN